MPNPKPRKRKVVPKLRKVAKAIIEPVAVPNLTRWERFQFWTMSLPSRVRQALAPDPYRVPHCKVCGLAAVDHNLGSIPHVFQPDIE